MNALTRFDTNALNRAMVGFDNLFNNFETRFANQLNTNYPPYNIGKLDEDNYFVVLAIAGFKKDEIVIEVSNEQLSIKGERKRNEETETHYLHLGLSARDFHRQFQ